MSEKLKYGTLFLFVSGVILIVFLQFLSGENINRLVARNKTLLNEVSLQNDLRKLEADVLTVESDIRGLVITGDSTSLPAVQEKFRTLKKK
jgi:CHASE3 domain sensor protein